MSMKAFVIFGSPNPEGHTAKAVDGLLAQLGVTERELFSCFERYVASCCDCRACAAGSGCVLRDEFSKLVAGARAADLLIFAYPIYFEGMPAPMKAVIDRMQQFFYREKVCGRMPVGEAKAAAVVTMGGNKVGDVHDGVLTFASRALGARYFGHAAVRNTDTEPDFTELYALAEKLK
ncbi:MAG TPA: flavodoxin family protein [Candidatus Acidoferrum sp.]|nr:flavodoxin family protein [Candidatus Acidoferrum sp.]